ncbi:MAG: hypothetical protein KDB96_19550, partial [Flavobacteriales bacterium]|nr:hypothetical protein [Flavobacteriales bacterium]
PARQFFGMKNLITMRHLEAMNKVILATSMMVGYAYLTELFIAWYGGNPYERFAFLNRVMGNYSWAYWSMFSCNVIFPPLFWFKKIRRGIPLMMIICVLVNVGMWFERFVITVTSLSRDFIPSSWGYFTPTLIDALTFIGSFGLFFTLFLLFCRWLPMVAVAEVKADMPRDEAAVKGA